MAFRQLVGVSAWNNNHYCVPTAVAAAYGEHPDRITEIIHDFLNSKSIDVPKDISNGYAFEHWTNAVINHFGALYPIRCGLYNDLNHLITNNTDKRTLLVASSVLTISDVSSNQVRRAHVTAVQGRYLVDSNTQGILVHDALRQLKPEILAARIYSVLAIESL